MNRISVKTLKMTFCLFCGEADGLCFIIIFCRGCCVRYLKQLVMLFSIICSKGLKRSSQIKGKLFLSLTVMLLSQDANKTASTNKT